MAKFLSGIILLLLFIPGIAQNKLSPADQVLLQTGHNVSVYAMSFSADEKSLISAGLEGDVILWDFRRGVELKRFSGHPYYLYFLKFCPGDSTFVVTDAEGFAYAWNIYTGKKERTLSTGSKGNALKLSIDGSMLAVTDKDTCRIYSTKDFSLLKTVAKATYVYFTSSTITIGNDDGVQLFEADLSVPPQGILWPQPNKTRYEFSPDSKFLIKHDLNFATIEHVTDTSRPLQNIGAQENFDFSINGALLVTEMHRYNENYGKNSSVVVYDLNAGTKKHIPEPQKDLQSLCISASGKYVATASIIGHIFDPIRIWDVKTGQKVMELKAVVAEVCDYLVDPVSNQFYTIETYGGRLKKWDLNSGEGLVWTSNHKVDGVAKSLSLNKKREKIVLANRTTMEIYATATGELIQEIIDEEYGTEAGIVSVRFWPDDNYLLTGHTNGKVKLWSVETGERIAGLKIGFEILNVTTLSDTRIVVSGTSDYYEKTMASLEYDPVQMEFKDVQKAEQYKTFLEMKPAFGGFVTAHANRDTGKEVTLTIFNKDMVAQGTITGFKSIVRSLAFKGNDIIAADDSGWVYIIDRNSKKIKSQQRVTDRYISNIELLWNGSILAVHSIVRRNISFFQLPNLTPLFTLYDGWNDWCILNKAGYYFGSKKLSDLLYFSVNKKVYSFDQFDILYNRPDTLLQAIPGISPDVIKMYKRAFEKRLSKFSTKNRPTTFETLIAPDLMAVVTDSSSLQRNLLRLKVIAGDKQANLSELRVYVNGVPEPINRFAINKPAIDTSISIDLSYGENLVEVSVRNELGIESSREHFRAYRADSTPVKDLYILAYGCSKFKQADFNLKYPAKDANDLAAYFKSDKHRYRKVQVVTLTDELCTKENWIAEMNKIISGAGINDNVVLFFGSHGMVYKDNYFLATYDTDFGQPGNNALGFTLVDSLLYRLRSRNKAVMIDACQSGELDKEYKASKLTAEPMEGVVLRAGKALPLADRNEVAAFALMKDQFADLEKNAGATILAASSGMQAAMESDAWKNGLFTYTVINGLTKTKADSNEDYKITIGELKKFTEIQVSKLSNGAQRASTRAENIMADFILW